MLRNGEENSVRTVGQSEVTKGIGLAMGWPGQCRLGPHVLLRFWCGKTIRLELVREFGIRSHPHPASVLP